MSADDRRWRDRAGPLLVSMALLGAGAWLGHRLAGWGEPPTRDEIAHRLLAEGRALEAAELFSDPTWRGVALYRAGRYQRAADMFAQGDDADAAYNRGNSLVRSRSYDEARQAYRLALARDPGHAHAQTNLELLSRLDDGRGDEDGSGNSAPPQGDPEATKGDDDPNAEESQEQPKGLEQRVSENPPSEGSNEPGEQTENAGKQQAIGSTAAGADQPEEERHDDALAAPARSSDRDPEPRPGDSEVAGGDEPDTPPSQAAEQSLAEQIAMRRLVDDPALVLRARLRAAARARVNP